MIIRNCVDKSFFKHDNIRVIQKIEIDHLTQDKNQEIDDKLDILASVTYPKNNEKPVKRSGFKKATGIIIVILGIAFLVSGLAMLYLGKMTDSEGYSLSNSYTISTNTYAFWMRISPLEFRTSYSQLGLQLFGVNGIAETKWVVKSVDPNKELFLGLASVSAGEAYLNRMETEGPYPYWEWFNAPFYAKLEIFSTKIFGPGLGGPTKVPAETTFWIDSTQFRELGTIYWDPYWVGMANDKYLVIMNLDGSQGVQAKIQLGYKTPIFSWLQYILVVIGGLFCLAAFVILKRR